MASPSKEKGKASTSGTAEPDCINGGLVQTDSASMASKLAASASGLTRSLLGIGAAPGDAANVLTPSGTAGKSQNPLSNGPGASSTWTDSSSASRAGAASLAGGSTRCNQPFRTEAQHKQESEQDFANFLEIQPMRDLELPPTITQSHQLSSIGETIVSEQQLATGLAKRTRDRLIDNDVNPKTSTASQFQSFREQDMTSTAQQAIELLVANRINPELLTASQLSSFQRQNLVVQRKSINVYLQNKAQHKIPIGQREEQHAPLQGKDGEAVVALLSQPKFLDLIDTSQDDEDLPSISSLDLTSSQVNTIERLKALFPAAPVHNPPPPAHVLNPLPIEALATRSPWDSRGAGSADIADHADRRQQWLRDWDGFLRAYTDEVWGDLLPLVKEAREELEEAKENDGELRQEGGAVRRLAMVLGHLRDDKLSQKG